MKETNTTMTYTENLIENLTKHSNKETGEILTNSEGVDYQFTTYTLKYKKASRWLVNLFNQAAKENNANHANKFATDTHSFYFDRNPYKGQPDGKITMKELRVY